MSLPPVLVFGIVGIVAALLIFGVGLMLVRAAQPAPVPETASAPPSPLELLQSQTRITWTDAVTGERAELDESTRIDMLERLAIVGMPWCVELLERAADEERDYAVLDAAERALIVVRARPAAAIAVP